MKSFKKTSSRSPVVFGFEFAVIINLKICLLKLGPEGLLKIKPSFQSASNSLRKLGDFFTGTGQLQEIE